MSLYRILALSPSKTCCSRSDTSLCSSSAFLLLFSSYQSLWIMFTSILFHGGRRIHTHTDTFKKIGKKIFSQILLLD